MRAAPPRHARTVHTCALALLLPVLGCHLMAPYESGEREQPAGTASVVPGPFGVSTNALLPCSADQVDLDVVLTAGETSFDLVVDASDTPHVLAVDAGQLVHLRRTDAWHRTLLDTAATGVAATLESGSRLHVFYGSRTKATTSHRHTPMNPGQPLSWSEPAEIVAEGATALVVAADGGALHLATNNGTTVRSFNINRTATGDYRASDCLVLADASAELSVDASDGLAVLSRYRLADGSWRFHANPLDGPCSEIPLAYSPPGRTRSPAPVAIDDNGVVHFGYVDDTSRRLYVGTWDGMNALRPSQPTGQDRVEAESLDLVINDDGTLFMSYESNGSTYWMSAAGNQWVSTPLAPLPATRSRVRVDQAGAVHVLFSTADDRLSYACVPPA